MPNQITTIKGVIIFNLPRKNVDTADWWIDITFNRKTNTIFYTCLLTLTIIKKILSRKNVLTAKTHSNHI